MCRFNTVTYYPRSVPFSAPALSRYPFHAGGYLFPAEPQGYGGFRWLSDFWV